MQGKGEGVNEVVKMGEIWGVWKGRWKVGCLGEKELHVCTGSTLKCITPPFISSFLHEFFFLYIYKYICVVDIHIPF